MATAVESPGPMPDTPLDADDVVYPCKGCGDILEEGKAFELAGNRWHLDCFRCNTCGTLLDSDANLLLLGDGSLICNNCTYSCSACGNKIEDLAILTGDQAFCANCFKCRNCKRKIENLRYAKTSQGIFCMSCHEALMARRRKRSKPSSSSRGQQASTPNSATTPLTLDKSLPALPPKERTPGASAGASEKKENIKADNETTDSHEAVIPISFDPSPGPPRSAEQFRDVYGDRTERSTPGTGSRERNDSRTRSNQHIAYQDKGNRPSGDPADNLRKRLESASPSLQDRGQSPVFNASESYSGRREEPSRGPPQLPPQLAELPASRDSFKLQDVPRARRSSSQKRSSRDKGAGTPVLGDETPTLNGMATGMDAASPPIIARKNSARRGPPLQDPIGLDKVGLDRLSAEQRSIPRKQVPRADSGGDSLTEDMKRVAEQSTAGRSPTTKVESAQVSPDPSAPSDAFDPPPRSSSRPLLGNNVSADGDSFTSPREAPAVPPPLAQRHRTNNSVASVTSESREPRSPVELMGEYGDGPVRLDRDDDAEPPGLFRKVSKAVRHGRSSSDRVGTSPKWSKNRNGSVDISSPIPGSPDAIEDASLMRNKLRFAQQRVAELEAEKLGLQEKLNSAVDIRQANTELKEKRSTMAFLDTQKEMVVRELEVMTDHLAKAKEGGEMINIDEMKSAVMRDFAASLGRLKENLQDEIEDLVNRKNELTTEIANLIQMKDKGFQEYEALSTKNAQLVDLNNQLVAGIQDMYKQSRNPSEAGMSTPPSGLGIYTAGSRTGSKTESPLDIRAVLGVDTASTHTALSGDTEVEPLAMSAQPQVVNIRKGQAKKFNWKKGGSSAVKGVAKGFKGAFSSSEQRAALRDEHLVETGGYNGLVSGDAPVMGDKPLAQRSNSDQPRLMQSKGFLSAGKSANAGLKSQAPPASPADSLFGSELSARCEFEKRTVPAMVLRCIEEVELRGMTMEGVYRKSGSYSQVKAVQQGFEKDGHYDISDPDLDIHAVTSALKQFLRKLPNPLITYEVYDQLLDAIGNSNGGGENGGPPGSAGSNADGSGDEPETDERRQARADALRNVVAALPKAHRDTLQVLLDHLGRIMEHEKENLMTCLNLAVVFAPTIMRPLTIEREMSDMELQRKATMALLKHGKTLFPDE